MMSEGFLIEALNRIAGLFCRR